MSGHSIKHLVESCAALPVCVGLAQFGKAGNFIHTKMAMNDIAYNILLATGIRIQPLPVWESEWAASENYSNPYLLQNIVREGITL